jgi:hypothetical protein
MIKDCSTKINKTTSTRLVANDYILFVILLELEPHSRINKVPKRKEEIENKIISFKNFVF